MIWKDKRMENEFCPPKFCYVFIFCFVCYMNYRAIHFIIMFNSTLEDKIVVTIGTFLCSQYSLCVLFVILFGSKFIKSIKKEDDQFIITNDFNKQAIFNISDVQSVETSTYNVNRQNCFIFSKGNPRSRSHSTKWNQISNNVPDGKY